MADRVRRLGGAAWFPIVIRLVVLIALPRRRGYPIVREEDVDDGKNESTMCT